MALQTLYRSGAFGMGSDLWIIPDLALSSWSRTIDWYLNYQISKAQLHTPAQIDGDLKEMAEVGLVEPPVIASRPEDPLMVASLDRLPGKQVIVLPPAGDFRSWLAKAHAIWRDLGRPSVRLFLPPEGEVADLQKLWPDDVEAHDITVVPASTGTG